MSGWLLVYNPAFIYCHMSLCVWDVNCSFHDISIDNYCRAHLVTSFHFLGYYFNLSSYFCHKSVWWCAIEGFTWCSWVIKEMKAWQLYLSTVLILQRLLGAGDADDTLNCGERLLEEIPKILCSYMTIHDICLCIGLDSIHITIYVKNICQLLKWIWKWIPPLRDPE